MDFERRFRVCNFEVDGCLEVSEMFDMDRRFRGGIEVLELVSISFEFDINVRSLSDGATP